MAADGRTGGTPGCPIDGAKVTGTVGIVLWAQAEGLIPSVRDALYELRRQAGFFLKQELIEAASRQAGEEVKDENTAAPTDPM